MQRVTVNGAALDYESVGSGEPVLLVGTGPFADSFLPLLSEDALCRPHRLIRYRQRGQIPGVAEPGPVSFAQHAADAAALLAHLDIDRAHVAGHSTGAAIGLQLSLDSPGIVQSLALLEPPLMGVPSAAEFLEQITPSIEAFRAGEHERAMVGFLTVVTSLEWEDCRDVVEARVQGGPEQALAGSGTFFGSYLPALQQWQFGPEEAARISQPLVSVCGTNSHRLFADGGDLLRSWFPRADECSIDGVAHLLHMQRPGPVAACLAEFFGRHPIT